MVTTRFNRNGAYTLIEVLLVIGLLLAISAMVVPNFARQIQADELPRSARQLRTLITLVRAHASFDAKRYRIRFPNDDEQDAMGEDRQPMVEREDDPIEEPEVFNLVTDSWALGKVFLGTTWCAEVRMGKPTIELLQELQVRTGDAIERELEEQFDEIDPDRLPLVAEPDGSTEWAVFVLTTAPRETDLAELVDYPRIELIIEGPTGMGWLQRPFYDTELDLFEEKGWPAVLRQDFLSSRELTEDDVLELREGQLRGRAVEVKGRKLEETP